MEPFDVFIADIPWENGEKRRPVLVVLVLNDDNNNVSVYPITTKYAEKSKAVQERYFKINDWAEAGLIQQSFIDTYEDKHGERLVTLPVTMFQRKIGKLTVSDKLRFLEFLKK